MIQRASCVLVWAALLPAVAGCAAASDDASDTADESSLSTPSPSRTIQLGGITYGETKGGIAGVTTAYLGLTFTGKAGDAVVADVTAEGEDANGWILDDANHAIARDTTPTGTRDTHVAHLAATLQHDGTYTLVFREAHREATTFTVHLEGPPPPPPPPPACTWARSFELTYGQAWNPADVGFVTADGRVHRGMSTLDLPASKNQVPDIVRTLGSGSNVREIDLYGASGQVLASRVGPNIYGLGDAMWHQVNFGQSDLVETTLLRLFTEPVHSYAELKEYFRKLTAESVSLVRDEDKADYAVAAQQLMASIDVGSRTFKLGTGHAIDFGQTTQYVNGKTFSFQFSDAYGLDPKIGMQRNGVWIFWPTIAVDPICASE